MGKIQKFKQKMASPTGVDKERSDEEREQRERNPRKSEQSHFFAEAKNDQKQKVKLGTGQISFDKVRSCFLRDCER